MSDLTEISRRRTFAIISHPDAGKTTLTEKLLLYGGAVELAGTVTARKSQNSTASDWMELEKKRGISISSTVLQFDYNGYRLNLLDTPGHKDFAEDTYRVLTAVDAVIMVIDAGKGIESQTRKLFEVCRQRHVPIFTFMNKLDRPTRSPLALLDELESTLKLHPYPINWPLGMGSDFRGLYDRTTKSAHLFERTPHGAYRAPVGIHDIYDPMIREKMDEETFKNVSTEISLLDETAGTLDHASVLRGQTTPVFFGSAMNNFGVQLLLDGFLQYSTIPSARNSSAGVIEPTNPAFSGFIFKIQGNMDPKHRDRLAFIRVCSGKFTREMQVHHSGSGKQIKLTYAHRLFGQERRTVDEAYPGDVFGLVCQTAMKIGDTLTEDTAIQYNEIPRFPCEHFSHLHNLNQSKFKAFRKGLEQLLLEGVVQNFTLRNAATVAPLLAAVGPLQFEVLQYRLETEYGAETRIEPSQWKIVRWMDDATAEFFLTSTALPAGVQLGTDANGLPVVFFSEPWSLKFYKDKYPTFAFFDVSPKDQVAWFNQPSQVDTLS